MQFDANSSWTSRMAAIGKRKTDEGIHQLIHSIFTHTLYFFCSLLQTKYQYKGARAKLFYCYEMSLK